MGHGAGVPPRTDVPAELLRRPFTLSEAQGLGLTRDVLRAPRFSSPHRGVRMASDLTPGFALDVAAARLALPATACFSEWTTVRLLDLPTPWGCPEPVGRMVQARVPPSPARPRVSGIQVGRWRSTDRLVLLTGGDVSRYLTAGTRLRLQDPVSAWCDLAPGLPHVDAVALGDAVRRHHATQEEMQEAVDRRSGCRGVETLRRVFADVRHQVDSPMETEARLLFTSSGLPEPECGRWVPDASGRMWQVDMVWFERRVIVEYDGDVHRLKGMDQWRHDEDKRTRLREGGWTVVVLVGGSLDRHRPWEREETVARVRRALTGS